MPTIRLSHQTRHRTEVRGGALVYETWRPLNAAVQALLEALPERSPEACFCGRDPLAAVTLGAAALWPEARVVRHDFDAWEARLAAENLAAHELNDRVESFLTEDFPDDLAFPLATLVLPSRGAALFGKECLEMAHDLLAVGGRLLVATDGSPRWLLDTGKKVFGRSTLQTQGRGAAAVVRLERRRETPRHKPRQHPLRFPFEGREMQIATRPGVFSAKQLDPGTRALLQKIDVEPGESVLDLGCGAGALGLAAATLTEAQRVVLVDSHVRAVALARDNAEVNGLEGVEVLLRADLEDLPAGPFDCVLANPPYFSGGRIAESFARSAAAVLAPEGRIMLVAKDVSRHREILAQHFERVEVEEVDGYGIHRATGPRPTSV